jgi:hypothetical protein
LALDELTTRSSGPVVTSAVASACGEWWRLLLLVVVVPAGCLCHVHRRVLLVQLLRPFSVLAALPSSFSVAAYM